MAYYIISFHPGPMEELQKRIPFLDDAIWVKDKQKLNEIKAAGGNPFFLVHLTDEQREALDEMVLIVRDVLPQAKIIYFTENIKAQKAHQLTPVGGDAYVTLGVDPQVLSDLVTGLLPPDINQHGNRLEESIDNVRISSAGGLEDFKNHPKSKEIDEIFAEVFGKRDKKPLYQSTSDLVSAPLPDEEDTEISGDDMSDKDQELSLDDLGDLELSADGEVEAAPQEEEGLDLDLGDDAGLDLSAPDELPAESSVEDDGLDLSLDDSVSLDDVPAGPAEADDFSLDDSSGGDELSLSDDEAPALDFGSDGDDLSLDLGGSDDDGLSLSEDGADDLNLGGEDELSLGSDDDLSLGGDDELSLGADDELSLGGDEGLSLGSDDELSLGGDDALSLGSDDSVDDALSLGEDDDLGLNLGGDESLDGDLSDDAKEKLKEIDAIMDLDASQIGISMDLGAQDDSLTGDDDALLSLGAEETADSDIDKPLVGDDLDLGSLNFGSDEQEEAPQKESKKKSKEVKEVREATSYDGDLGKDLKEISGAYSGEMERLQATISNLRSDREELLAKIQKLEEEKVMQNRQALTMRAELDEKKIELSIIRKKLNDEISELKDRMKLQDEKRLILEEKNRVLLVELDKANQKNKIDVKKVQMRERELEQKLELLKADSETQIRHRDLKILELKRKIDAMEFDMESITVQEKKSVESRYELEDKLDKAIKTLRNAISVLEDESDNKSAALSALKKNIDM